jgi:hypothetical protein
MRQGRRNCYARDRGGPGGGFGDPPTYAAERRGEFRVRERLHDAGCRVTWLQGGGRKE